MKFMSNICYLKKIIMCEYANSNLITRAHSFDYKPFDLDQSRMLIAGTAFHHGRVLTDFLYNVLLRHENLLQQFNQ